MTHMTQIEGVPDKGSARPGMAYFEGTGPAGKVCRECSRCVQRPDSVGKACAQYKKLAGRWGPKIREYWRACKYFDGR